MIYHIYISYKSIKFEQAYSQNYLLYIHAVYNLTTKKYEFFEVTELIIFIDKDISLKKIQLNY